MGTQPPRGELPPPVELALRCVPRNVVFTLPALEVVLSAALLGVPFIRNTGQVGAPPPVSWRYSSSHQPAYPMGVRERLTSSPPPLLLNLRYTAVGTPRRKFG